MLPNFVIIGAQKAGTTSLYHYLQSHPDVHMPRNKEPDFFVAERNWDRGLHWYERQFDKAGDAVAVGEASTTYTMHPHYPGVPARIVSTLPDVKLVYLLRDPVERARSDYVHYRYPPASDSRKFFARECLPIERALLENPLYLDTSRYAMQIDQYLEHIDRDRLLVITTEELAADRTATVRRVLTFVGVDPDRGPVSFAGEHNRTDSIRVPRESFERAQQHAATAALLKRVPWRIRQSIGFRRVPNDVGVMAPELRARVADLLRDDARRLRDHLGPDFPCWGLV